MSSAVRVETRPDGVAVLTFDQAGSKANVLTEQMWTDFEAALDELAGRTDVRGLVLASAKPGIFIAGADLKLLGSAGPNDPAVRVFIEQGLRVLEKLEALPFPTCAAIDGVALGGGLEVALACDYRVCGTNPRVELGLPEVTLGLIPGWGGTQRLPRVIPWEYAVEMLWSGRSYDRQQAINTNLVLRADPSDVLIDRVAAVLLNLSLPEDRAGRRKLKNDPIPHYYREEYPEPPDAPTAVPEVFLVMTRGAELPLADAIALETEAFLRLAGSDESKRLIAEFFAGRKKAQS